MGQNLVITKMNLLLLFVFIIAVSCTHRLTKQENDAVEATCGVEVSKAGGKKKSAEKYPWSVAIQSSAAAKGSTAERCGGALISQRHVITTAHCVVVEQPEYFCNTQRSPSELKPILMDLKNYSVYIGGNCHGKGSCAKQRPIAKVFVNEMYKYCSEFHDTAVIELQDQISFKEALPICLPTKDADLDARPKTVGFRGNATLRSAKPTSRSVKVQSFGQPEQDSKQHQITIKDVEGQLMCMNGGGNPLFQLSEWQRLTLLGIQSPNRKPCMELVLTNNGSDIHFADIRYQVDWICATTGVCPRSMKLKTENCDESKGEICGHTYLVVLLNGTAHN